MMGRSGRGGGWLKSGLVGSVVLCGLVVDGMVGDGDDCVMVGS